MKLVPTPLIPIVVLCLAGCAANAPEQEAPGNEPWLRPSPVLEGQIEDQIDRLPWTHGQDRAEIILWLATVGEPAYAQLIELCADPRPDVAASALAALGATRDARLPDHLWAVGWPEVLPTQVKFERARALVRLGDWSEVRVLIDGLEDEEVWTRAWCARALEESTQLTFGFDPRGDEEGRAAAIASWRDWLASRENEGILITQ